MNLINFKINDDTHPYLARLIHAYQSPGPVPSRMELLEAQHQLYQTEGHLTLEALSSDAGIDSKSYIEQIREAEELMAEANEDKDT